MEKTVTGNERSNDEQFGGVRIFIPMGIKAAGRIRGMKEEMKVQEQKSPLGVEERR